VIFSVGQAFCKVCLHQMLKTVISLILILNWLFLFIISLFIIIFNICDIKSAIALLEISFKLSN